jgi:TP901 family phage tail tape measure protein
MSANPFILTAQLRVTGPVGLNQVVRRVQQQVQTALAAGGTGGGAGGASGGKGVSAASPKNIAVAATATQKYTKHVKTAVQATNQLNSSLLQSSRRFSTIVRDIATLTGGMLTLHGALLAVIGGFKNLVEYERQLGAMAQITRSSIDITSDLGKEIRKLGKEYGVSSALLGKNAIELLQAGRSIEQVKQALPTLALLGVNAQVGAEGLAEASKAMIVWQNTFKQTQAETAQSFQKVVGLAKQQFVSVSELIEGTTILSATAKSVGLSFKEMISAIAATKSQAGRPVTEVARALNTLFARMASPQNVKRLQEGFNIDVFDQGTGNIRNIFDIAEDINRAKNELGELSEKGLELNRLLGGIRRLSLAGAFLESLKQARQNVRDISGSLKELDADFARVRNTLGIQFGQTLEGLKSAFIDVFTTNTFQEMISDLLNLVKGFTRLVELTKQLYPALLALTALRLGRGVFGGLAAAAFAPIAHVTATSAPTQNLIQQQQSYALGAGRSGAISGTAAGARGFVGYSGPIGPITQQQHAYAQAKQQEKQQRAARRTARARGGAAGAALGLGVAASQFQTTGSGSSDLTRGISATLNAAAVGLTAFALGLHPIVALLAAAAFGLKMFIDSVREAQQDASKATTRDYLAGYAEQARLGGGQIDFKRRAQAGRVALAQFKQQETQIRSQVREGMTPNQLGPMGKPLPSEFRAPRPPAADVEKKLVDHAVVNTRIEAMLASLIPEEINQFIQQEGITSLQEFVTAADGFGATIMERMNELIRLKDYGENAARAAETAEQLRKRTLSLIKAKAEEEKRTKQVAKSLGIMAKVSADIYRVSVLTHVATTTTSRRDRDTSRLAALGTGGSIDTSGLSRFGSSRADFASALGRSGVNAETARKLLDANTDFTRITGRISEGQRTGADVKDILEGIVEDTNIAEPVRGFFDDMLKDIEGKEGEALLDALKGVRKRLSDAGGIAAEALESIFGNLRDAADKNLQSVADQLDAVADKVRLGGEHLGAAIRGHTRAAVSQLGVNEQASIFNRNRPLGGGFGNQIALDQARRLAGTTNINQIGQNLAGLQRQLETTEDDPVRRAQLEQQIQQNIAALESLADSTLRLRGYQDDLARAQQGLAAKFGIAEEFVGAGQEGRAQMIRDAASAQAVVQRGTFQGVSDEIAQAALRHLNRFGGIEGAGGLGGAQGFTGEEIKQALLQATVGGGFFAPEVGAERAAQQNIIRVMQDAANAEWELARYQAQVFDRFATRLNDALDRLGLGRGAAAGGGPPIVPPRGMAPGAPGALGAPGVPGGAAIPFVAGGGGGGGGGGADPASVLGDMGRRQTPVPLREQRARRRAGYEAGRQARGLQFEYQRRQREGLERGQTQDVIDKNFRTNFQEQIQIQQFNRMRAQGFTPEQAFATSAEQRLQHATTDPNAWGNDLDSVFNELTDLFSDLFDTLRGSEPHRFDDPRSVLDPLRERFQGVDPSLPQQPGVQAPGQAQIPAGPNPAQQAFADGLNAFNDGLNENVQGIADGAERMNAASQNMRDTADQLAQALQENLTIDQNLNVDVNIDGGDQFSEVFEPLMKDIAQQVAEQVLADFAQKAALPIA